MGSLNNMKYLNGIIYCSNNTRSSNGLNFTNFISDPPSLKQIRDVFGLGFYLSD